MIAFTKTASTTLKRMQNRARIRKDCKPLKEQTDYVPKQMSRIIKEVLNDILIDVERAAVLNIEQLRRDMLGSTVSMAHRELGVASSEGKSTKKDIQNGRMVEHTVADVCARMGLNPKSALLLYKMIRAFKPFICLEMGTGVGISCCYQASALKLNGEGRMVSMEGCEEAARIAQANIDDLEMNNVHISIGPFDERLTEVLEELVEVDFVFIDGPSNGPAVLKYVETIHPYLSNQAILAVNDIHRSESMAKAWTQINADPRVKYSFDLNAMGICFLDQNRKTKSHFNVEL